MKLKSFALLSVGVGIVVSLWLALSGDTAEIASLDLESTEEMIEDAADRPAIAAVEGVQVTNEPTLDRVVIESEKRPTAASVRERRDVVVRVVDGRGDPVANCPIRVGCEGGVRFLENAMLQVADEAGRYRFPEETFEQTFGTIESDARFVFDVGLALRERACERVAWSECFEREIVLHAPGLGAIEVEVVRGGAPLAETASIDLEVTYESGSWFSDASRRIGGSRFTATLEAGRARLAPIPLGLRFWPNVRLATGVVSQSEPLAGPLADGEIVRTRIELEAAPYLTFRIADDAGRPFADEPIVITRFERDPQGPNFAISTSIVSDGEGRCTLPWPAPFPEGGSRTMTVGLGESPRRSRAAIERAGTVEREFEAPFTPGRNDLGELRLVPRPLLVAGRVLDSGGAPIPNASVMLEIAARSRGASRSCVADGEGRFEFYGAPLVSQRVRATAPGYERGRAIEFAPGDGDFELVLGRGSNVRGNVAPQTFCDVKSMTARLSHAYPTEETTAEHIVVPGEDGSFEFLGVSPGRHDFVLDVASVDRAIVIENVVVPANAAVLDPRLADLSLAGRLRSVVVTVEDRDGVPIAGARVEVERRSRASGSPIIPATITDEAGTARVIVANDGQTVLARAEGYRPAWREDVRGDVELVLSKALAVTLRARGDAPLAAGNRTLSVALEPISGPGKDAGKRAARELGAADPFLSDREAHLVVPFPGRYRVVWHRAESAPNLMISTGVGGTQEIELFDTPAPQLIEVDPPAKGLEDL